MLLYVEQLGGGDVLLFHVESTGPRRLRFSLDFRPSRGIAVEPIMADCASPESPKTAPGRLPGTGPTDNLAPSERGPWWKAGTEQLAAEMSLGFVRAAQGLADGALDQV